MLLDDLKDGITALSEKAGAQYGELSYEQLNWKPDKDLWSVGQVFEHLIVTNELYLANLKKVVNGTYRPNFWSKIPFISAMVGSQIKKAVNPENKKKVTTFSVFEPASSDISESIVEAFQGNQDRLIEVLDALSESDLSKKIVTPVSNLVTIKVSDALEVIVSHEQRHFEQALEVTRQGGFPSE